MIKMIWGRMQDEDDEGDRQTRGNSSLQSSHLRLLGPRPKAYHPQKRRIFGLWPCGVAFQQSALQDHMSLDDDLWPWGMANWKSSMHLLKLLFAHGGFNAHQPILGQEWMKGSW